MKDDITKLINEHFPGEVEQLPDGSLEHLIHGEEIEIIRVNHAPQIDVGATVVLISGAIGAIKISLETIKKAKDLYKEMYSKADTREEIEHLIRDKYPMVALQLEDAFDGFVDEIITIS